jgi:hypothetical protein
MTEGKQIIKDGKTLMETHLFQEKYQNVINQCLAIGYLLLESGGGRATIDAVNTLCEGSLH